MLRIPFVDEERILIQEPMLFIGEIPGGLRNREVEYGESSP